MIAAITDIAAFKLKALQWAATFPTACCLDSNNFNDPYSKFDALIAAGARVEMSAETGNAFAALENFQSHHQQEWLFGFFTYDLKQETEGLVSANPDHLQFPDLYFFVPQHLIIIKGNDVTVLSDDRGSIIKDIDAQVVTTTEPAPPVLLHPRIIKADYISAVNSIREHIARGNIYVTNFCQEFFKESTIIDPIAVYRKLNQVSPNPFSAFFKHNQQYVICASPERFLSKRDHKLISQPIKGTTKRLSDATADAGAKSALKNNKKEQQENVMIVDLVRNDLTLSAKLGTVKTEELFGIYSFNQLHHMISTVTCELRDGLSPVQAIKNTFPMGSMTGAPKVSAMQLMEKYEQTKRGVYSGALGYFSPDGDFDFNVVIRTLLYNTANNYLSLQVGSAITFDADAEHEYEECLLKASAVFKVLGA